ncbi:uncharacterized protein N7498_005175 [Penicillium cinerascens]|uniref:Uncharacterized protein n=1 Tax=Penicillium cinerascens TaxID=70096 RepID=A0A9W9MMW8_9EURO|nr:uncharacterized protein N7498_005175 [Penicillium cinerascens]KAJ5204296.1 hypothetical protein N7498_005175 [Penicillium cinerascens]
MSQPTFLAVIPPPPSFDPSTYKPFDEEFERTVDRILSEDASFESKNGDFPVYSGGESFTGSANHLTPQSDRKVEKSRFFATSPAMSERTPKRMTRSASRKSPKSPRTVAKRDITVIHLDSDDEEDVDLTRLVESVQPETVNLVDEEDNNGENCPVDASHGDMDGAVDSKHNSEEGNIGDEEDNNVDTNPAEDSDGDADCRSDPLEGVELEKAGLGDDINPIYASHAYADDPNDSRSNSEIAKNIDDDLVAAEEDIIFASVEPSRRDELLHFVVSHSFMQNREAPVRRSLRRQFVKDMRREAASVGMNESAIDGLILYVRRLYLEDIGAQLERTGDAKDLPFGNEIDDEYNERTHRRKSRKRNMSNPEQAEPARRKKSRGSGRNSVENTVPTPQSTAQAEIPTESKEVEATMQSPSQVNGHETLCKEPGAKSVHDTPDTVPSLNHSNQAVEEAQHEPEEVVESSYHQDEGCNLDANQFETNTSEPTAVPSALEKVPNEQNSHHKQQFGYGSPGLPIGIPCDSQPSEPDLPPLHERAIRPLKSHKSTHTRKRPQAKVDSGITVEQTAVPHLVIDITRESPSPDHTVPSELTNNEPPTVSKPDEPNGDRQGNQSKHSSDHVEKIATQRIKLDTFNSETEPGSGLGKKKEQNYRKKERKKRKKRQSFLETHSGSNEDQQAVERPHTPDQRQPRTVATTPPSRTSNRSSDRVNYEPLSPNPAEWDMDF